ncbi:MAG TPA: hypothetical protein VL359_17635 [bacterium]|nr:hypothetical protein [bacterium]
MKNVLVGLGILLSAVAGWPQPPLVPSVRQVDYVVETFENSGLTREQKVLFVLYVGNAWTQRVDREAEHSGACWQICLVRPVADARRAAAPADRASRGGQDPWYLTEIDSQKAMLRRGPLLTREAWQTVPLLARHAYLALRADGQVILISWNGFSGSLSIYFSPEVQEDRGFYEQELRNLTAYLEAHGHEADVPFERVDPSGPAGSFGSS